MNIFRYGFKYTFCKIHVTDCLHNLDIQQIIILQINCSEENVDVFPRLEDMHPFDRNVGSVYLSSIHDQAI